MARPLRIEYTGALYHVTSRGNERAKIFIDDKDRTHCIQLLKEGVDFFRVEVISYCLMSNHYHLLLRTKDANLSRFMQWLNTAYTMYFNVRYKRVGHLFQGRYKAIVVGSEEYLLVLSRYIHLNPIKVKTHIQKSQQEKEGILQRYKWSSFAEVIDPSKRSKYFKCSKILDNFRGDTAEGRNRYREYVFEGIEGKEQSLMKDVKIQLILGSKQFTEWIKERFIKGKDKTAYPHLKGILEPIKIETIAKGVAESYGIRTRELLENRSRHREARQILIELNYRANIRKKSLTELGRELGGITGSAIGQVHKRVGEKVKRDSEFSMKLDSLIKELSIVEV